MRVLILRTRKSPLAKSFSYEVLFAFLRTHPFPGFDLGLFLSGLEEGSIGKLRILIAIRYVGYGHAKGVCSAGVLGGEMDGGYSVGLGAVWGKRYMLFILVNLAERFSCISSSSWRFRT